MIDHCSYIHNWNSCEIRAWKKNHFFLERLMFKFIIFIFYFIYFYIILSVVFMVDCITLGNPVYFT